MATNVIFSEKLCRSIEHWRQVLRMNAVSCSLVVLNLVATTLGISWVNPSYYMYMMIGLKCSRCEGFLFEAYGKSNISSSIRMMLRDVRIARNEEVDINLCLDEFSRAGLVNSLDNSTKIFLADEADITFVDAPPKGTADVGFDINLSSNDVTIYKLNPLVCRQVK